MAKRAGRPPSARICSARRRLRDQQVARGPPGPGAGEQLGGQQRVGVEARPVGDGHGQRPREEGGVGQRRVLALHGAEVVEDTGPALDEGGVARGQVVEAPEAAGHGARIALTTDDEAVGRRHRDVLDDAQVARDRGDVLAPVARADVEAVVDGRAAEQAEVVAEGVAGASPGLGDREGDEVPPPVPVGPVEVLVAGAPRPVAHGGQRPEPVVGGSVLGAQAGAVAHEEALAEEAAEARAHLLGRTVAGLGHRERVGRRDRPVVPGHAEHEHAGGEVADAHHRRRSVSGGVRVGSAGCGRARLGRAIAGRFPHDRQ